MSHSSHSLLQWFRTREGFFALIGVFSTVFLGVLFFLFGDKAPNARDYIAKHETLIRAVILVVIAASIGFYLGLQWTIRQLGQKQVDQAQTAVVDLKKENRGRWDDIKVISCSYIVNPPLCYRQTGDNQPQGVGLSFLKFAFPRSCINISPVPTMWDKVIAEIRDGKASELDTCLSPLYETFERQRDVVFSAPLFYANIGLYVPASFSDKHGLKNLSFREARERLNELKAVVRFGGVEGELSAKLARKYCDDKARIEIFGGELRTDVTILLNLLVDDPRHRCNTVFFESLLGDVTEAVKQKKVINILRHKELLYPVGFALRRGDYLLRNLINLKVLEARDNGKDLIKEWAIEHCNRAFGSSVDASKHFVTEDDIVITSQEMGGQYAAKGA